jgi:AraC-like DNA-binding protein
MELRNDFSPGDPISQLLSTVQIRSTVYCRSVMGAPWGFGVEAHGNPAFHLVSHGQCWLEVDDQPDQLRLATGDLVVLPTGRRHRLRDDPATPARRLEVILTGSALDEHRRLRYGGRGPRTELLCGGFAIEGRDVRAILRVLPSVLHIRGTAGRPAPWVTATVGLLSAELASDAPGSEAVVSRLADALLIQALRIGLAELQAADGARVLALRDPQIACSVELVHRETERAWTVGELASEVSLSRSAFAARFQRAVGESPMRYLIRARLAHAAGLLHRTDASLAEIAARTGYATEFSFSKAFKRTFGVAPGAYRGGSEPPALELVVDETKALASGS